MDRLLVFIMLCMKLICIQCVIILVVCIVICVNQLLYRVLFCFLSLGKLWVMQVFISCCSKVVLLCEVGSLNELKCRNDGDIWYMMVLGLVCGWLLQNMLCIIFLLVLISDNVCVVGMFRWCIVLLYRNLWIDECSIVCLLVLCEYGVGLVFFSCSFQCWLLGVISLFSEIVCLLLSWLVQ